jgi:PAS domain S-box-containing protein
VRSGVNDRIGLLSAIGCACTEAIGDEARLRVAITEPLGAALGADCRLVLAADVLAPSVSSVDIALRHRDVEIGTLRLTRSDPPTFDDDELALARSVAAHAAVAWSKHAKARLQLTRFALLDRAGMLGILVSDLEGHVFDINETLAGITGYSVDEIRAPTFRWRALTPPEWLPPDVLAAEQLTARGVSTLREKPYIRKDGTRVWVAIGSTMFEDQIVSFVLDIDARKQADHEAQRARETRAIAEVHAHLAAIVDSSDDAIIGKTLDGIVTSWNRGAEKLFGYMFEEVRGTSITLLIPPGREHEERELLAHLRNGEVTRFDTVRRCKNGQDIEVSVTSSPVYDAGGALIGASKVARDITSRRAAELALARAVGAAESANRELEAFSYSVAHDLRAPLRAISGFSQILEEDYGAKLDDEARELIDDIRGGARTMGTLIDALLSLARVTRSERCREPTDLAAIVHNVAATLAATHPERHVDVVAAASMLVSADPRLARVIVDNLVGNAWKFTGKISQARIEVGETEHDGARAFYVRDNGAGFDMAHAANLFGPFQRLHTVREFAGTGIGLATVQRIVHRHGGRIWAESAVNAGATFYFTLGPTEELRA